MTLTRILFVAITIVTLQACALSPQMVELKPRAEVTARNVGNNKAVVVSGSDQRDGEAFGTRGGIYGNTSLIRPANDVMQSIISAAQKGLQSQGFNAYTAVEGATAIDVRLKELSYVPEKGSIVNSVEVKAVLEAAARNAAGDEYIGTYRAGNVYQQPLTPSAERNEIMINEVLNRALKQMLVDPKLLNFAAGQ
jgi:uncharacterized lipoprotein